MMNHTETLEQLELLRSAGQSDDIDNILASAIDRIHCVLAAEADAEEWATGLQRRIAHATVYGVPSFMLTA